MTLTEAISRLDQATPNPSQGLPEDIFLYISRTTPLVNVDLLIKDESNRTLLAWRDDQHSGEGWHVPGGIVRFQETLEQRIQQVAWLEIGISNITFEMNPVTVNELIISKQCDRGHFISFLYRCFLSSEFEPTNLNMTPKTPGYLAWHSACPQTLLPIQNIYKEYI